jgi:predicted membrane protein (TIGR00267 family)
MAGWFRRRREQILEADKIVGVRPIARRYFAMNAFDGVVTTIGIVMGSMVAGIEEGRIVLATGFVASVAMGISGFWGAYLTETAERHRSLDELERHTLTDLSGSSVGRASRLAVVVVTVVDGLSPFLGALVVLIPFLFARWIGDISSVYVASLATAVASLFALGAYLGHVSGERMWVYALKTSFAGLVAIGVGYLLRLLEVTAIHPL